MSFRDAGTGGARGATAPLAFSGDEQEGKSALQVKNLLFLIQDKDYLTVKRHFLNVNN